MPPSNVSSACRKHRSNDNRPERSIRCRRNPRARRQEQGGHPKLLEVSDVPDPVKIRAVAKRNRVPIAGALGPHGGGKRLASPGVERTQVRAVVTRRDATASPLLPEGAARIDAARICCPHAFAPRRYDREGMGEGCSNRRPSQRRDGSTRRPDRLFEELDQVVSVIQESDGSAPASFCGAVAHHPIRGICLSRGSQWAVRTKPRRFVSTSPMPLFRRLRSC